MSSKCPNCRKVLESEHSFCPHCGFDLRSKETGHPTEVKATASVEILLNSEKTHKTETKKSQSYFAALVAATIFSISSIFIWSYIYTGNSFDLNSFLSRLINHSFWLFIFPLIVSLFFKKDRRANVFSNVVTGAVILGIIFLFFGYSEFSNNKDPFIIRLRLLQPCSENVINQMAKYDIPYTLKEKRSKAYCTCLIDKLSDTEISNVGRGSTDFWSLVKSKYNAEGTSCVEESLKITE